jgi:hypothetical protein
LRLAASHITRRILKNRQIFSYRHASAAGMRRAIRPFRGSTAMKANVVLADRSVRMGLGMLLLASPLLELPTYPFNLLGLVLVATAVVGFCPLYAVFGALAPKRHTTSRKTLHAS